MPKNPLSIMSKLKRQPELKMVDSVLNANKGLDFVKRMYEKKPQTILLEGERSPSTHLMTSAETSDEKGNPIYVSYPKVVRINGSLVALNDDDAYNYAMKNGEYIKFNTDKDARFFAENGYKKGKGIKIMKKL